MTRTLERDIKRDKELIKDYKSGKFSNAKLVGKYEISMTRIYQILDHYGIVRLGKGQVNNGKSNKK